MFRESSNSEQLNLKMSYHSSSIYLCSWYRSNIHSISRNFKTLEIEMFEEFFFCSSWNKSEKMKTWWRMNQKWVFSVPGARLYWFHSGRAFSLWSFSYFSHLIGRVSEVKKTKWSNLHVERIIIKTVIGQFDLKKKHL